MRIILLLLMGLPCFLFAQEKTKTFEELKTTGFEFVKKGDYQKAITFLTEAESLQSGDAELYTQRALAYQWSANAEKAFEDYTKAIEIAPSASLYANRATVRPFSETKEKVKDLNKAIELDKTQGDYFYQLAMVKYEMLLDLQGESSSTFEKTALEKEWGFSFDICETMEQVSNLNPKFEEKANFYCNAVAEILH